MALDRGCRQQVRVLLAGMATWQAEILQYRLCVGAENGQHAPFTIVGVTQDASETLRSAAAQCPDVVVLNFYVHGLTGLETARRLHAASPASRIVMLGDDDIDLYDIAARRAGASAYLPWMCSGAALIQAVRGPEPRCT